MNDLNLKERRLALGLSIAKMAAVLGVSKGTYDNWERGASNPSEAARAKVAQDLDRLEGKMNHFNVPLSPEASRALQKRAESEGKTPEEILSDILKWI